MKLTTQGNICPQRSFILHQQTVNSVIGAFIYKVIFILFNLTSDSQDRLTNASFPHVSTAHLIIYIFPNFTQSFIILLLFKFPSCFDHVHPSIEFINKFSLQFYGIVNRTLKHVCPQKYFSVFKPSLYTFPI